MAVPDDNGGKAPAGRTNFRTWTDDTGQHTTEAALVDFSDGQVRLRTADGSVLTVPVDRLSQADREFLRGEAPGGRTDAEGPGFLRRQAGLQAEASDVRCTAGDRAQIPLLHQAGNGSLHCRRGVYASAAHPRKDGQDEVYLRPGVQVRKCLGLRLQPGQDPQSDRPGLPLRVRYGARVYVR